MKGMVSAILGGLVLARAVSASPAAPPRAVAVGSTLLGSWRANSRSISALPAAMRPGSVLPVDLAGGIRRAKKCWDVPAETWTLSMIASHSQVRT
jgi:hypothetical protein